MRNTNKVVFDFEKFVDFLVEEWIDELHPEQSREVLFDLFDPSSKLLELIAEIHGDQKYDGSVLVHTIVKFLRAHQMTKKADLMDELFKHMLFTTPKEELGVLDEEKVLDLMRKVTRKLYINILKDSTLYHEVEDSEIIMVESGDGQNIMFFHKTDDEFNVSKEELEYIREWLNSSEVEGVLH